MFAYKKPYKFEFEVSIVPSKYIVFLCTKCENQWVIVMMVKAYL